MGTTVITFDVDGTLIRSAGKDSNKLHKRAFAHAWKAVFDVEADIDEIQHHGLTDGLILVKMLEHRGMTKPEAMKGLVAMENAMTDFFEQYRSEAGTGLQLLPGISQLLTTLKARKGVAVGLVTGNLEPIAWAKMEALGILSLFSQPLYGGFGSDYCSGNTVETWRDRGELVRIAGKRARDSGLCPDGIKASFHVGDTPMDVQASAEGGASAIGVLTGIYSREDLLATGVSATILDDMQDTDAVLRIFGL